MSHYDVLNVPPHASDEDVKRAYKTLARVYHPDQNPSNVLAAKQRFQKINDAYNAIMRMRNKTKINDAENDNHHDTSWLTRLAERIVLSRRETKTQENW